MADEDEGGSDHEDTSRHTFTVASLDMAQDPTPSRVTAAASMT